MTRHTCRCARRWSVERELEIVNGKDSLVRNFDHGIYEFKVNIMPKWKGCVDKADRMSQMIQYAKRITWTEHYNTSYSGLKFELSLNSNRSKVFELWCIDDVVIKYTIRVILCKKNHVKRNTITHVIASSNLNWIWI